MTVASFASEGLARSVSPAASRVSLQHTVVAFLLIEVTIFFLCAIGANTFLEISGRERACAGG
jgi:hypothetical protein